MATKNHSNFHQLAIPIIVSAQLLAIVMITLVHVWIIHFEGGLAFKSDNKQKIFNFHPFLMVIGFLISSGEAIMAYKSVPAAGKRKAYKLVHLMLHFIALVSGIIGIYAVFKFHDELRIPHMFTLHSWIGMSTICLFAIQWVFGFLCFWWPGAEKGKRARLAPWHAFFGVVIFGMAILSAETGLVEKFVFLGLRRGHEAFILNFLGLLILLFAVFVGLSVLLPRG